MSLAEPVEGLIMGKSSAPAPQPDFAGIMAAQAAAQQTQLNSQIAQQQLAWAQKTYADNQKQIQPIIDRTIRGMDQQYDYATQQKDFWDQNYKGIEEDFANQAQNWDTPQRREQRAGEAAADVSQQFEGARQAAAQQLKDYGVDPSSGRYASTDFASRITQAATAAGAQNMARRGVEQEGLQLKQAAINTGRGYSNAINQTWGTAGNSGNSAVGNLNASAMTGSQMMGNPTAWAGNANSALGTWGNIANNNYSNYMQGYQFANTPQSSGLGSALGLAGGMAMSAMKFEEGGPVPPDASPSAGAAVDDVPARINVGEFVVPKEAVSWFGEKYMHDLIIKAQKERSQVEQQSGAVPDVTPANSNERPTFVSGQRTALPMGGA